MEISPVSAVIEKYTMGDSEKAMLVEDDQHEDMSSDEEDNAVAAQDASSLLKVRNVDLE